VIVVDTSVWIEANRRPLGTIPHALRRLIDADEIALPLPVRLELVAGIARKDRRAFVRALSGLPVIMPTEETWRAVEGWIPAAADKGQRFAVTDLLIAGLAHDIDALVWSMDDDFGRMERLGFVRRYEA
jgi:predicted nucleic acid-binding protein